MPGPPEFMLARGREPDPDFRPDETLYRRVPPELADDHEVELNAIEFPDMSVTRSKYGPPDSARWIGQNYVPWQVIGFEVQNIPDTIPYLGEFLYRMRTVHRPLRQNYPHSEVQVFEARWERPDVEVHVGPREILSIPRDAQQIWRERLLRACRIVLRQDEDEVVAEE